ncbi:MAG: hypothetical protein ABSA85_11155 [Terracidiphilus sp.]|jgi:hypothetical protein
MKFTFTLPDPEATVIEFYRSALWGGVWIKANGQKVFSKSAFNPSSQISFSLTCNYQFSLPGSSPRHVCITKKRPFLFAGFRRNRYIVTFNGQPIEEHFGY